MASPLQKQSIRDLGIYGVIRSAEVDDHLIPEGAVVEAINVNFDRKGAATLRPGVAALGSTIVAGNSALGLFNAQNSALIASFLSGSSMRISNWSGAAWNTLYTGTGGSTPTRFVDFSGNTVIVSGLERSIVFWNGSGLDSVNAVINASGNPINSQQLWYVNSNDNLGYIRPKFAEVYKSRLYLSGDSVNPDRLYFSAVISSSGNLAWTPTTSFVDINPSDGENITALKRYSTELLIFKPNYIYRFTTSGTDPDAIIKVGTRSHESVVEGKRGLYFFHDSGFYQYQGGYPTEISRPISDIVTAIPYSQYSIMPGWKDNDHIYWYVGTLTINDPIRENETWPSVVVRYTESSGIWTVYSHSTGITRGVTYNSTSALSQVVGTTSGVVATYNSGTSDISSESIKYRLVTKWYEWGGIENRKLINRIVALCLKAQNSMIMYQVDDEQAWKDLGQLRNYITYFDNVAIRFRRIRFKFTGISSVEALVFQGLEIVDGINEGIIKQVT